MYGHSLQTYREYHSDIYPETNGYLAAMGPDDWWKSKCNNSVPKISLDPKKRPKTTLTNFNDKSLSDRDSSIKASTSSNLQSTNHSKVETISSLTSANSNEVKVSL